MENMELLTLKMETGAASQGMRVAAQLENERKHSPLKRPEEMQL